VITPYACPHPGCHNPVHQPQVGDLIALGISDEEAEAGRNQPLVHVTAVHYEGPDCPYFDVEVLPEHAWFWEGRQPMPACSEDCFAWAHPYSFHLYGDGIAWGET
jgi:hypothetical protein